MSIRPTIVIVALLLVASLAMNWRYVGRLTEACPRIDRGARMPITLELGSVSMRITDVAAPSPSPAATAAVAAPAARARARASLPPIGTSEDSRFVIVTFATQGVVDFALNWVLHIRALQLPHLVGAMDDELVEVCDSWRIPVHAVHRDNPDGEHSREAMSGVRGAGMANLRGSDKGFAGLGVLKTLFIQHRVVQGPAPPRVRARAAVGRLCVRGPAHLDGLHRRDRRRERAQLGLLVHAGPKEHGHDVLPCKQPLAHLRARVGGARARRGAGLAGAAARSRQSRARATTGVPFEFALVSCLVRLTACLLAPPA
jgi:hypothetical protein